MISLCKTHANFIYRNDLLAGYTFSLTWIRHEDREGELMYHVSSLGTLERIALDWMKEDVIFSMTMCPVFFKRISRVIGRH